MGELLLWLLILGAAGWLLATPFLACRRFQPRGRHERRHVDERRAADRQMTGLRATAGEPRTLAAGTLYYGERWPVDPRDLADVDPAAVPAGPAVGRVPTEPCEATADPVTPVTDPGRPTAAGVNLWFAARIAETCGPGAR